MLTGADPEFGFNIGHFMALRVTMRKAGEPESPLSQGWEDLGNISAKAAKALEEQIQRERDAAKEAQDADAAVVAAQLVAKQAETKRAGDAEAAAAAEAEAGLELAAAAVENERLDAERAEQDRIVAEAEAENEAQRMAADKEAVRSAAAAEAACIATEEEQARLAGEQMELDRLAANRAEQERKLEDEQAEELRMEVVEAAKAARILANPDGLLFCRKCGELFEGTICDNGHANMHYRSRKITREQLELKPDPDPASPSPNPLSTLEAASQRREDFRRHQQDMLEQVATRRADNAAALMEWSTQREAGQVAWAEDQRNQGSSAIWNLSVPLAASPRRTEASWQQVAERRTMRRQRQTGGRDAPERYASGGERLAAWRAANPPQSPPAPAPLSPVDFTGVKRAVVPQAQLHPTSGTQSTITPRAAGLAKVVGKRISNRAISLTSPIAARLELESSMVSKQTLAKQLHDTDQEQAPSDMDLTLLVRQALLDLNRWRPEEPAPWLADYFLYGCKPPPGERPSSSAATGSPFPAYLAATGIRQVLETGMGELRSMDVPPAKPVRFLAEYLRGR